MDDLGVALFQETSINMVITSMSWDMTPAAMLVQCNIIYFLIFLVEARPEPKWIKMAREL